MSHELKTGKNIRKQILTCLIGDPVEHSVSDRMFGYFASIAKIEKYHHLKLRVPKKNYQNLSITIRALSIFDIAGTNVTLPYKETVTKYLHKIDKTAKRIGAVNTIANKNSKLVGYNTDGLGAVKAIERQLRPIERSDYFLIFGVGGAARAVIGSLPPVSGIMVLYRKSDLAAATRLKKDFKKIGIKINVISNKNIVDGIARANFIVNATPVGMYPKNRYSLINEKNIQSADLLSPVKNKLFFDVVFNPFKTSFLEIAEKNGAKICPGIYMTIYQGIEAFRIWTGKKISEKKVNNICELLQKEIEKNYEK
jgi:shikimate dehydrogenase